MDMYDEDIAFLKATPTSKSLEDYSIKLWNELNPWESTQMSNWRDSMPKLPDNYNPHDIQQAKQLLLDCKVRIVLDDKTKELQGWAVSYKGGCGLACPILLFDSDGDRARLIIALSVYLHVMGTPSHLCNEMAYWYIEGPRYAELAYLGIP